MGSERVRVVAGCCQRTDGSGHVLVCQRQHGDAFSLLWEFPGGKVEAGESDHDALARELREELGVQRLSIGDKLYEHDFDITGIQPFTVATYDVTLYDDPHSRVHASQMWVPERTTRDLQCVPSLTLAHASGFHTAEPKRGPIWSRIARLARLAGVEDPSSVELSELEAAIAKKMSGPASIDTSTKAGAFLADCISELSRGWAESKDAFVFSDLRMRACVEADRAVHAIRDGEEPDFITLVCCFAIIATDE